MLKEVLTPKTRKGQNLEETKQEGFSKNIELKQISRSATPTGGDSMQHNVSVTNNNLRRLASA